ncbi:uncharacterized protein LOC126845721 [Adelges cooleyi]|uniref:uncharacterized protein LOC126845721 n=1 Tax=Adelges cooleyi TaxID=133065 RepID=UPI0021807D74|nr:uncharacterized protein LOC126845721 [Adelges cooleyi]
MFHKNSILSIFVKSSILFRKKYNFQSFPKSHVSSTFNEWILMFFKTHPPYNKFVLKPTTLVNNDLEARTLDKAPISLKCNTNNELLNKFSSTSSLSTINEIDKELENRIDVMTIEQIMQLMDSCLTSKNKLSKNSKAFKRCLQIMNENWFRRPDLNCYQTVQLMYYASIYKHKAYNTISFGLQKIMNELSYVKKFSNEELSVLAVATYKTGVKVNDKLLRLFVYRLEKKLDELLQKPILFISLLKPLKKAKYHDPTLIKTLTTSLKCDGSNLVIKDFTSSVHLLSYLADSNCGDIKNLQKLIDSIENSMIQDNMKNYRIKDLTNFLFSVSYLGITLSNHIVEIIDSYLYEVFNTKDKCIKYSNMLISVCLSMWMLKWTSSKLIQFVFSQVPISALRSPNIHKQNNRLDLLLTSVSIEKPELLQHCKFIETIENMPKPCSHINERPLLLNVFKNLQELSKDLKFSSIEYNFSIPNLKILGIKIINNNKNKIYVEVLDSCTCLANTGIPNGTMKLKLRLESKLNFTVITVNHMDNVLQNSKSLKIYLESLLLKQFNIV